MFWPDLLEPIKTAVWADLQVELRRVIELGPPMSDSVYTL